MKKEKMTVKKKAFDTAWYLFGLPLWSYAAYKVITEEPFTNIWLNYGLFAANLLMIFWFMYELAKTIYTKVHDDRYDELKYLLEEILNEVETPATKDRRDYARMNRDRGLK